MSFPNLPDNIGPTVDLDAEDVLLLLLVAIAFEELALAHIINSEAEKLQGALGTLVDAAGTPVFPEPLASTLEDLLDTNRSVERMLRTVIKKEMLLQFQLEDILDFFPTVTTTTTTEAPPAGCETCSIFYNTGNLPATVAGVFGATGDADPLRIRFCAPCSNPQFNDVLLNFNDESGTDDFSFNGFVTDITSCSAATDTATLEGEGTITGNPAINGDYNFTLQITGGTTAVFTFTNQSNPAQTLTVTVATAAPRDIEIVDCTD